MKNEMATINKTIRFNDTRGNEEGIVEVDTGPKPLGAYFD
jgi:hypothetical protein